MDILKGSSDRIVNKHHLIFSGVIYFHSNLVVGTKTGSSCFHLNKVLLLYNGWLTDKTLFGSSDKLFKTVCTHYMAASLHCNNLLVFKLFQASRTNESTSIRRKSMLLVLASLFAEVERIYLFSGNLMIRTWTVDCFGRLLH